MNNHITVKASDSHSLGSEHAAAAQALNDRMMARHDAIWELLDNGGLRHAEVGRLSRELDTLVPVMRARGMRAATALFVCDCSRGH